MELRWRMYSEQNIIDALNDLEIESVNIPIDFQVSIQF